MKKFFFGSADIKSGAANFGLLILRVGAGLMLAFMHGIGKLPPAEKFIAGVADIGFPYPVYFAWAAVLSEFLFSLMAAAGLMTRIAAFFVSCTMATAAYKHLSTGNGDPEKALLYLAVYLAIMLIGGGKFAVDRRFSK